MLSSERVRTIIVNSSIIDSSMNTFSAIKFVKSLKKRFFLLKFQFQIFKMKFHLIIVLVPAICIAANGESSTKELNSRRVADGGQFPFHISLRTSNINSHVCSGAILSQRFILTAASCVRSYAIKYAVLGALGKNDDGQRIGIEDIKEHEFYNPVLKANNIALVQTAKEIDFSFWIQPIALPPLDWIDIGRGDTWLNYRMTGWNQEVNCVNL